MKRSAVIPLPSPGRPQLARRTIPLVLFVSWMAVGALPIDLEDQKLTASTASIDDRFGSVISVDGNTAIVGAPNGNSSEGSAHIFHFDGSGWTETQLLSPSLTGANFAFGHSVAISGNVAIVGQPFAEINFETGVGAAYVYRLNGSSWVLESQLLANNGLSDDEFGWSVAIDGSLAVVGARRTNRAFVDQGSVYVFEDIAGGWSLQQEIVAPSGQARDEFGSVVGISSTAMIVGAPRAVALQGAAYVFRFSGAAWAFEATLGPSDPGTESFGSSVDIFDDHIIVGEPFDDFAGMNTRGAAYIYRHDPALPGWILEEKFSAFEGQQSDQFGSSVSISDGMACVGALGRGLKKGQAYTFRERTLADWVPERTLVASDGGAGDNFGYAISSIAPAGSWILVGNRPNSFTNLEPGAAYVYEGCGPWRDVPVSANVQISPGFFSTQVIGVIKYEPDAATLAKLQVRFEFADRWRFLDGCYDFRWIQVLTEYWKDGIMQSTHHNIGDLPGIDPVKNGFVLHGIINVANPSCGFGDEAPFYWNNLNWLGISAPCIYPQTHAEYQWSLLQDVPSWGLPGNVLYRFKTFLVAATNLGPGEVAILSGFEWEFCADSVHNPAGTSIPCGPLASDATLVSQAFANSPGWGGVWTFTDGLLVSQCQGGLPRNVPPGKQP